jgi:hypothetical protein
MLDSTHPREPDQSIAPARAGKYRRRFWVSPVSSTLFLVAARSDAQTIPGAYASVTGSHAAEPRKAAAAFSIAPLFLADASDSGLLVITVLEH